MTCKSKLLILSPSLIFFHLLCFLDNVFDGADIKESRLGILIHFTVDDCPKATDGVLYGYIFTGNAGKVFRHMERLGQKLLYLSGSVNGNLILFGKLFHTEDGNDILQFGILL